MGIGPPLSVKGRQTTQGRSKTKHALLVPFGFGTVPSHHFAGDPMTTPDLYHRLDEALGLLQATFEGGEVLEGGRNLLAQARERAAKYAYEDAHDHQGDDPIAVIAKLLKIAALGDCERDRLTTVVCTVLGAYSQARLDEAVPGALSSDVRALLENAVLHRVQEIQQDLRMVQGHEDAELRGENPAAHHATRLLQQAALQVAVERATPPRLRPFGPPRKDLRPLTRGLRIHQGRVSAAGRDASKRSLRHAVTAASNMGLDHDVAAKAEALAELVERTLFGGDPVGLLAAATQRALSWLPDANDRTNFDLGPQPGHVLSWGCIEIMTAFGTVVPSGSDTGALQNLMRTIDGLARPVVTEYGKVEGTIFSRLTKAAVAVWRDEGRAATLFCDESRQAVEDLRAAEKAAAFKAVSEEERAKCRRRELETQLAGEYDQDLVETSYGTGKRRR